MDLSLSKLEEEFNITNVERNADDMSLESVKKNIEDIISDISLDEDPDKILLDNISRANRLLDEVEGQVTRGNFSSRVLEVASQLIDSVTKATSEIRSSQQQELYLRLRDEMLKLKKVETVLKAKKVLSDGNKRGSEQPTREREIIVTDRETILKMLEDGKDNG